MDRQISRYFINELMTRVDIAEIIDHYVQLKKAGKNFVACCPFHNEKTPSFIVFPNTQNYHCFGCQVHGNVISFLMDYAHFSFVEAVQELATRAGVEVVYEIGSSPEIVAQKTTQYDLMAQVAAYFQTQLPNYPDANAYLQARGLQIETIQAFGLGYAPAGWDNLLTTFGNTLEKRAQLLEMGLITEKEKGNYYDRFRQRIIFPIYDRRGRVIAFGGRVLDDSKPKYLNSPETPLFQKGRELYGWHWLKKGVQTWEQVLVVEGYMDVVMLAQYGIHNALATLGTAVTTAHLKLLFHNFAEVIFCFDDDTAGVHAAWRALETSLPYLRDSCTVGFMFFPEGDDPDSRVRKLGTEQFRQQLKQGIFKYSHLSKYLFDTLEKKVDMSSIEGHARLIATAKPLLKQLPFGSYRHLLWQELSARSGISLKKLIPFEQRRQTPTTQDKPLNQQLELIPKLIRFLLYEPTLVAQVKDIASLATIQASGVNLLIALLTFIQHYPNLEQLNTAMICQQWAETPEAYYLNEIASQEMLLTEPETVKREFQDMLALLYQLHSEYGHEQRLDVLFHKTALTAQEKAELRWLSSIKFERP